MSAQIHNEEEYQKNNKFNGQANVQHATPYNNNYNEYNK
jgi:hypothetical protein